MDRSTTVAQFRRPSLHNRLVSRASLGGSFSGRRMGHQQRLDRVRWIASTMDDRYTVPGTTVRFGGDAFDLIWKANRRDAELIEMFVQGQSSKPVFGQPQRVQSRARQACLTKILYRNRGAPLQAVTWFSAMTLPTVSRFFVFMGMPSVDTPRQPTWVFSEFATLPSGPYLDLANPRPYMQEKDRLWPRAGP